MWLTNVIFDNRSLQGECLELADKDALYFLGDNLTLRHCEVFIRVPKERLHINHTQFIDCSIEAKRVLKGFRWESAHLKGCQFKGRFLGNDFGQWPSSPGLGSIEGCDFTQANLHLCRFMDCDTSTLRFPSWPCFTVLDPILRRQELAAVSWPGDIGLLEMKIGEGHPSTMAAVTYSALDIEKRTGVPPEALRAILETLPGVKY